MDLSSLDALYTDAEVKPKGDFAALPDGKYQVAVHQVEMTTAKTGTEMLVFQLKILAGDHAGQILFKRLALTANSISFLKQDLTMLGWDKLPSALRDPMALRALLDVKLEVAQKTKGADDQGRPNTNVYFNRRLDATTVAALPASGADAAPF